MQNLDASLSNTPTQTSSSSGDSGLESPDMLQPDTPGASSPTEAAPSSTSTLSPNSTPAPTSSDQGGGFNPIIWGVGAAVVAVGVAIGAFLLHRRRRRSSSTWQDMHDSKAKVRHLLMLSGNEHLHEHTVGPFTVIPVGKIRILYVLFQAFCTAFSFQLCKN